MIYSVTSPHFNKHLTPEISTVLSTEEHELAMRHRSNGFYAEWFDSEAVRMTVQREYIEATRPGDILGTWGAGSCAIVIVRVGNNLLLAHVDAGGDLAHLATLLEAHGVKNDLSNATVVLAGTEATRELRSADYPRGYDELRHIIKVREVETTGITNRKWSRVAEHLSSQGARVHFVEWGKTESRVVRVEQGNGDVPVVSAYARVHPQTGRLHVLVTRGFWLWEQPTSFQAKLGMAWMKAGGTAWPLDPEIDQPARLPVLDNGRQQRAKALAAVDKCRGEGRKVGMVMGNNIVVFA